MTRPLLNYEQEGNVCEADCRLAFQSMKYKPILMMVKFAADVVLSTNGSPWSRSCGCRWPRILSLNTSCGRLCSRSCSRCWPCSCCRSCPRQGAEEANKRPVQRGSASLFRQTRPQRHVQETDASGSGHDAVSISSELSGRMTGVHLDHQWHRQNIAEMNVLHISGEGVQPFGMLHVVHARPTDWQEIIGGTETRKGSLPLLCTSGC